MLKTIRNNIKMIKYIVSFSSLQPFIIILMAVFRSIQSVIGVLMLKVVVDTISTSGSIKKLAISLILFCSLNIFISTFNTFIEQKVNVKNIKLISKKMQLLIFKKSITLDLECFEDSIYYNKFTIAQEQSETRISEVLNTISNMTSSLLSISAFSILITSIDPFVVILSFLNVFFSFSLNTLSVKLTHKFYSKQIPIEREMDYVQRICTQSEYAKEIRVYDKFPLLLINRFEENLEKLIKLISIYAKKYIRLRGVQSAVTQLLNGVTILYLANKVFNGLISTGDFIALANGMQQLSIQLTSLIKVIPQFIENGIYIEDLLEYIEYVPKMKYGKRTLNPEKDFRIEFNNVSFKYLNTQSNAVTNLSFTINPGERIAFVGRNGAGKSTIIKLLSRLYDPTDGQIFLQGIPYNEYTKETIQRCCGIVFQDFKIFAVSLGENIFMDKISSERDQTEINHALQLVGLDKKVNALEKGINTEITKEFDNSGIIFSGGEFQRIAVARTFLKHCNLIILDEPASSLDPISEKELFDNIMKLAEGKAMIIVSHRLSNIKDMDRIIYLEDGIIKESGTHTELIQKNGLYAKMYKTQAEQYLYN